MSLRSALGSLLRILPQEVIEINDEVSINYEVTAYAEVLSKNSPVLIFKRLKDYDDFQLVSNMFSSRAKVAAYLGVKESELNSRWGSIMNRNANYYVHSRDGPVREIILRGDKANLTALPAPLHYMQDGGRYITSGIVVAKSLDNRLNLSYARLQLLGPRLAALSMHSRGHLWSYYQQYKQKSKNLPVSIVIGAHPIYYLLAAARIEEEYCKTAGLIDDYLIEGMTNELPVPANSEIVIEGEISCNDSQREGPFTEYTGYLSNRSTNNLLKVSAIYMRQKPIYLEINPSNSKEHILLSGIAKEPIIEQTVKTFLPSSYRFTLNWPLKGVHYVALACVENPDPGVAKQLGLMLLSLDHYLKLVFVSEGRCEMGFFEMLSQMLCTYNIEIVTDVFCNRLDPSADPNGTSSKAIIVCKSSEQGFTIRKDIEGIKIVRCNAEIHVGHQISRHSKLNVLVDEDIDPSNEEEVLWAVATRLQPAGGIRSAAGSTVVDARRSGLSRPEIPEDVMKRVREAQQRVLVRP